MWSLVDTLNLSYQESGMSKFIKKSNENIIPIRKTYYLNQNKNYKPQLKIFRNKCNLTGTLSTHLMFQTSYSS